MLSQSLSEDEQWGHMDRVSPAAGARETPPVRTGAVWKPISDHGKKDALTELSKEAQLILGDEGLFCHLRDLLKAGAEGAEMLPERNQCIHPTKCKTDS